MQAQDAFQDRYAGRHAEALALAHALCAQLEDLPAPDSPGLDWGHVGDLERMIAQLKDILGAED